jgi:hypothetical protein
MHIKVVNYTLSSSPAVAAFVDVEIDDWLRVNGLNFTRNGTVRPAQLTWKRAGKGMFRDTVQVPDADLAKLLAGDILAAVEAHIAFLPEEQRLRLPIPLKPRLKPNQPPATQDALVMTAPASKPSSSPSPTKSVPHKLKPLPPPQRLSARGAGAAFFCQREVM